MAATYTAYAPGITLSTALKGMLSLFNASGSGVVLKIYRIWVLNAQATGAAGVLGTFQIRRIRAQTTTGTATVTPVKHDTLSATLPAQVTAVSGGTAVTTDLELRRFFYVSDEPAVNTAVQWEDLQMFVPLSLVWDAGYGDSNVEPLTANEGQGFAVVHTGTASAAGNADIIFEFTT
jgi:hypothetical protein